MDLKSIVMFVWMLILHREDWEQVSLSRYFNNKVWLAAIGAVFSNFLLNSHGKPKVKDCLSTEQ